MQMGIDPSRIKPTKTTFKGVIPGVEARCTGSITLEVVLGSPDNFRSQELIFDIVPFRSGYHALLGRTAFTRFNAVPHYAYLKLKMPGPRGVITVNGGPLSPYRRAYCSPRGRSTKQPSSIDNPFGNNNPEHHQASPEYPATGSPGTPRARLAVRPPLQPHQGSIRAARTQLRTQNTMGTGGGAAVARTTLQYCFVTFSFTFKDIALMQLLQKSRIVGLTQERKPRRQQALRTKEIPKWNLFTIIIPVLYTYMQPALG